MPALEEYQAIEIAMELDKGQSIQEVAEAFGISSAAVRKIAVAAGLFSPARKAPSQKNKLTEEDVTLIMARIEEGELLEEIALDFGVSVPALRRICKKKGGRIPRALQELKRSELQEIQTLLAEGESIVEVARAYDLAYATVESLQEEYKTLDSAALGFLYETLMAHPEATPKKLQQFLKKQGLELNESVIHSYQIRLKQLNQVFS